MLLTKEQAECMLLKEVQRLVTAPLNQNQEDALTSFACSLGAGNLESSTLRLLLNAGHYQAAAEKFPRWNKAGRKFLPGLVRRRAVGRSSGIWLPYLSLLSDR